MSIPLERKCQLSTDGRTLEYVSGGRYYLIDLGFCAWDVVDAAKEAEVAERLGADGGGA